MYMGHEIGCIYEHRGGGSPSIHSQRYTRYTGALMYVVYVHTPQKFDGLLYCFSLSQIYIGNM